jgi:phosphoglycolate phosphatase
MTQRLVVFDVDGTLVDSQGDILAAMRHTFAQAGAEAPAEAAILGIVGLSLDVAMARLAPQADAGQRGRMVAWYKDAYVALRAEGGVAVSSPLYPRVREVLDDLAARPDILLGVATGKSRRGLDKLLDGHGMGHYFATQQVADHHPSKPHPSMLLAALAETGVDARDAVMVGDTSYDMEMAAAAGIAGVGVTWGYHPAAALSAARHVIDRLDDLPARLDLVWEAAA